MPELKNIRFSKDGDYGNKIFIANSTKEPETFSILKKFYTQLKDKYPDQFLPIFCNNKHKYATIRFKISDNFEKNDVYKLKFTIKKKVIDTKTYINCFLDKKELISKAEPVDDGEILDLDDM